MNYRKELTQTEAKAVSTISFQEILSLINKKILIEAAGSFDASKQAAYEFTQGYLVPVPGKTGASILIPQYSRILLTEKSEKSLAITWFIYE